ncbi:hypothetical protein QP162_19245 [Sphingomonas aurantiaca]|uniref:hypothetical protein n=1 Tax=Sphingomonas aurantiaca TaxID=185949 RepID=UPI002FE3AC27
MPFIEQDRANTAINLVDLAVGVDLLNGLHSTDHDDPIAAMAVETLCEPSISLGRTFQTRSGLQAASAPILSQKRLSNWSVSCSTKAAEGQTTSTGPLSAR